jgi:hypothetical protein
VDNSAGIGHRPPIGRLEHHPEKRVLAKPAPGRQSNNQQHAGDRKLKDDVIMIQAFLKAAPTRSGRSSKQTARASREVCARRADD